MIATKNKAAPNSGIYAPMRSRLYQLTRAYTAFLQAYFKGRMPGDYRWLPNTEETELVITGQAPIGNEVPHACPLISVVRSTATSAGTSMGGVAQESLLSQVRTLKDSINSTVVMNCLAQEGAEAETLAYLCRVGLIAFRKILHRAGDIHGVSNQISIGPVSAPGQVVLAAPRTGWRMVQVFSPVQYVEEVTVTPADERDFYVRLDEIGFKFDFVS